MGCGQSNTKIRAALHANTTPTNTRSRTLQCHNQIINSPESKPNSMTIQEKNSFNPKEKSKEESTNILMPLLIPVWKKAKVDFVQKKAKKKEQLNINTVSIVNLENRSQRNKSSLIESQMLKPKVSDSSGRGRNPRRKSIRRNFVAQSSRSSFGSINSRKKKRTLKKRIGGPKQEMISCSRYSNTPNKCEKSLPSQIQNGDNETNILTEPKNKDNQLSALFLEELERRKMQMDLLINLGKQNPTQLEALLKSKFSHLKYQPTNILSKHLLNPNSHSGQDRQSLNFSKGSKLSDKSVRTTQNRPIIYQRHHQNKNTAYSHHVKKKNPFNSHQPLAISLPQNLADPNHGKGAIGDFKDLEPRFYHSKQTENNIQKKMDLSHDESMGKMSGVEFNPPKKEALSLVSEGLRKLELKDNFNSMNSMMAEDNGLDHSHFSKFSKKSNNDITPKSRIDIKSTRLNHEQSKISKINERLKEFSRRHIRNNLKPNDNKATTDKKKSKSTTTHLPNSQINKNNQISSLLDFTNMLGVTLVPQKTMKSDKSPKPLGMENIKIQQSIKIPVKTPQRFHTSNNIKSHKSSKLAQLDIQSNQGSKDSSFTKAHTVKHIRVYSNTPTHARGGSLAADRETLFSRHPRGKSSHFKHHGTHILNGRRFSVNKLNQSMNYSIIDPVFMGKMRKQNWGKIKINSSKSVIESGVLNLKNSLSGIGIGEDMNPHTDNILVNIGEEDDLSTSSKQKSTPKKKSHSQHSDKTVRGSEESSFSCGDDSGILKAKDSKKVFLTSKIFTNERMLELRTSFNNPNELQNEQTPEKLRQKLNQSKSSHLNEENKNSVSMSPQQTIPKSSKIVKLLPLESPSMDPRKIGQSSQKLSQQFDAQSIDHEIDPRLHKIIKPPDSNTPFTRKRRVINGTVYSNKNSMGKSQKNTSFSKMCAAQNKYFAQSGGDTTPNSTITSKPKPSLPFNTAKNIQFNTPNPLHHMRVRVGTRKKSNLIDFGNFKTLGTVGDSIKSHQKNQNTQKPEGQISVPLQKSGEKHRQNHKNFEMQRPDECSIVKKKSQVDFISPETEAQLQQKMIINNPVSLFKGSQKSSKFVFCGESAHPQLNNKQPQNRFRRNRPYRKSVNYSNVKTVDQQKKLTLMGGPFFPPSRKSIISINQVGELSEAPEMNQALKRKKTKNLIISRQSSPPSQKRTKGRNSILFPREVQAGSEIAISPNKRFGSEYYSRKPFKRKTISYPNQKYFPYNSIKRYPPSSFSPLKRQRTQSSSFLPYDKNLMRIGSPNINLLRIGSPNINLQLFRSPSIYPQQFGSPSMNLQQMRDIRVSSNLSKYVSNTPPPKFNQLNQLDNRATKPPNTLNNSIANMKHESGENLTFDIKREKPSGTLSKNKKYKQGNVYSIFDLHKRNRYNSQPQQAITAQQNSNTLVVTDLRDKSHSSQLTASFNGNSKKNRAYQFEEAPLRINRSKIGKIRGIYEIYFYCE